MIILHGHTEHSIKESPMKIEQYISEAKKKGCTDIALTDTDTMTGVVEFMDACKDLHPIIGAELLIRDQDIRGTMVFLAKNQAGYQWICHTVKKANETKEGDKPCISMTELVPTQDVFVLSSSLRGILSAYIMKNKLAETEIRQLKEKMAKMSNPKEEGYLGNLAKLNELDKEIDSFETERKRVMVEARKKYDRPLLALESRKDSPEYASKKQDLEQQMQITETAKKRLEIIDGEVKKLKQLRGVLKRKIKSMESSHAEWYRYAQELEKREASLASTTSSEERAKEHIRWMKKNFSYFIELQYHGEPEEETVMPLLARLSREEGVGVVMENEPFFPNREDVRLKQVMFSMQENKWVKGKQTDQEYYIKEEKEFREILSRLFSSELIVEAFQNQKQIAEQCQFVLQKENHYPKYIEEGLGSAEEALRKKTEDGLKERLRTVPEEYRKRAEYELEVIIRMGFADYLLIVQDFIQYGKKLAKENNPEKVGYGIGPGRGSAAGSLVCYAIGITNIDPLKYNLKFERFLNVERVSMPDIDTDFSAEIRPACIEYVSQKYGKDSVALIRTKSTQKAKAALRNVTRVISDRDYGDRKHLAWLGDQMAKVIPNAPKVHLSDFEQQILSIDDKKNGKLTEEIYDTAKNVENLMTGLGVHAAGVIIGDGKPLSDYVPLLFNEEMNAWAVQCDMVEAEEIGLLKMDFLGLKNLDIMSDCIRRIKRYTGETVDLDTIPFEDDVFRKIFSTGKTGSVFQFESPGMRDMLQKFQPSSFDDIILLVAAYRPGPMDSIPEIIKVKQGQKKPYYCIPELEPILSNTYGYPIYQEQLMDIFSICAGFTPGEADNVRRFMSKKKTDKFLAVKPKFIQGVLNHGASEQDAEELWNSLVSFSAYAFNKSHAAAYAWISYQTAWLKYHYKEYYMCSVLNVSDPKKYKNILYECKEMDIPILLPDINRSGLDFENTDGGIRYGLSKIKSVRTQANAILEERKNRYFYSFKDFVARTGAGEKLTTSLVNAGCFDSFRKGMRTSYLTSFRPIQKIVEEIKKKQQQFEQKKLTPKPENAKQKKKLVEEFRRLDERIQELIAEYKRYEPDIDIPETNDVLEKEHELLYVYLSAHPLDAYKDAYLDKKVHLVNNIDEMTKEGHYVGMVKDVRNTKRKSDGKDMAFFTLEDISGSIEVSCFTREYEQYGTFIKEGAVVVLFCWIQIEDDGEETEYKLVVKSIHKVKPYVDPVFLSMKDKTQEKELWQFCQPYLDEIGHPVILHYQDTGNIRRTDYAVKKELVDDLPDTFFGRILFEYKQWEYRRRV